MGRDAVSDKPYRFATPPYANVAALVRFLPVLCPRARVLAEAPSALAPRVLAGEADAALMPVAAILDNPSLEMLRGPGVCARGAVRSVLLKCHRPPADIRTVRFDPASRSSNDLARIVLRWRLGRAVAAHQEGAGDPPDAAVMIGDPALCSSHAACGDIDLGAAWAAQTGLPFVFAAWATRKERDGREELTKIVQAARDRGVAAIEQLADEEAQRLGLPREVCREYLGRCIHYDIGPREREAIELFRRLRKEAP